MAEYAAARNCSRSMILECSSDVVNLQYVSELAKDEI